MAHDPALLISACAGESKEGLSMTSRRFPAPWQVEQIPGGYKVLDAKEKKANADIARVRPFDDARRIAVNVV